MLIWLYMLIFNNGNSFMRVESNHVDSYLNGSLKRKNVNWVFYRKVVLARMAKYELKVKLESKKD